MKGIKLFSLLAVAVLTGCGSSGTSASSGTPPVVTPPLPPPAPEPTPEPTPEPVPPPVPDLFVKDVTFAVNLHHEAGPKFEGIRLVLVRGGETVQDEVIRDGKVVVPQMLPGEVEVQLMGLSMLHGYAVQRVNISRETKDFQIIVQLREHGKTQVFGDSNTEGGGKIPATFVPHLEEDPAYIGVLNGVVTEISNRAVGGSGLTDVWDEPERYGALQVREYFDKLDRERGVPPLFVLYRFGLIDIRNRWHPDDFEEELRGIVELALSHGVVPVINYVSYQNGRDEASTDTCNEIFQRVATEYGLPLVDIALRWSDEMYYDEVHQSDEGNKVVAAYAATTLNTWLTTSH